MALRILVVDDEETDRHLIYGALQSAMPDSLIEEMSSGPQLIAWVDKERSRMLSDPAGPDTLVTIVLLDMHMPILTGLQTIHVLGDRRDLGYMPIVMLTASLDSHLKQQAYEQGVHLVLGKPAGPYGFYRVVEAVKQCYRDTLHMRNQLEWG
ncbi:response regulator [Spirosoma pollinicola]|uniref:Response regulatory domain-containing protein n=1 Tax=Spirosoma pollinicola TaxID=2057025 RepID=A0A2K8Z493_9BACT|nr:response regulator [Spirosoma pollinicola]AUD04671.1 hypothetical protein CWM47_24160 [Spirosoma pollinicola]